ncbi:hypothetical protein [Wenyingzhuangia sp. IMCC45574]
MARKSELVEKRNKAIKKRFSQLERQNYRWKYDALLEAVSEEFFLAPRTIKAIVNEESMYRVSA